jgi:hypothetical protein
MTDPKRDEREQRTDDDELKLPEERVDDLEPGEDEAADVKGGTLRQAWPTKYSGGG